MTTFTEPTGEAWVRQVNKRLAQLERLPHGGSGGGGTATISAADLTTETSVAFAADVLTTSGQQPDPSLADPPKMALLPDTETGIVVDPYLIEDYDDVVPVEGSYTQLQYAPVVPSTPYIESRATGLAVIWDGMGAGNEAMPVNLLLVEVHRSTEGPDFEPTEQTYAGSFLDAGLIMFSDQEYEVQWWYRFVLVTTDGLRSSPSDATDGTAHKISPDEVGFSASDIDFDGAIASANGNNKIWHEVFAPTTEANKEGDTWFQHDATSGDIVAQFQGNGGTSWTQTALGHQVIASLDMGKATVGLLTGNRIAANAIDGKVITGATFQTEATTARGIKISGAGFNAYSSTGVNTVNIDTATGNLTAVGVFKTAATSTRVEIARDPIDTTAHRINFYSAIIDAGMQPAYIIGNSNGMASPERSSKIAIISATKTDVTGMYSAIDVSTDNLFLTATPEFTINSQPAMLQLRAVDGLISMTPGVRANVRSYLELDGGILSDPMRAKQFVFTDSSTMTLPGNSTSGTSMGARGGAGTFTGPPSGMVMIVTNAQYKSDRAGQSAVVGFEVRNNSSGGSVVKAFDIDDAVLNSNENWIRSGGSYLVTGLTRGNTYYVRNMIASTGLSTDTMSFAQGRIVVVPML